MKINSRISIILCVVACALLIALVLISHFLIFSTLSDIEQKQATADMQLVLTRLDGEVEDVAATCRNWAQSDDTYRFINDQNDGYVLSNLAEPALFRDMKIQYVLFYNSSGNLVYSRGFNPESVTIQDVPQDLDTIIHNSIIPGGVPGGISGRRGYSMLDGNAIVLAGYPIASSTHRDSPRGTLVMVRQLDAGQISDLAQQTELDISLHPVSRVVNTDPLTGIEKRKEGGAILVAPVNDSVMEATTYITGIENIPTKIVVIVKTPRTLYHQVLAAMGYVVGSIMVLAIILIFMIRWPLKKYIVTPVLALDKSMKSIGQTKNISQQVAVEGDDEIRSLARSLNRMLEEIHSAQRQIHESEAKFRTLAETSVAGIFVFRQKNLYANPAAELQTGYSQEELGTMDFWEFIHPDFQDIVKDRWQKRLMGEEVPLRIEFKIIRKDGEERWIDASTTGFQFEGELASFSVRVDITRQKRIEETLRINEEKFRALTENTPDIVFSVDLGGRFTYISPQIERYGFSADEIIGKPVPDFVFPEDREQIEENFKKACADGHGSFAPFRILDKGQNVHWLEVNATRILDPSGTCTGLQGMIRDITERRKALDAITLANKKLNLMYDITRHDILNKITILFGLIDMTNASSSPSDREQFLREIKDAGTAIHSQIALTRDYQEVGVKAPRWNRMTEVIGRATAGFSNTGIHVEMDVENLEVYADPLIEKVIYNLVDNAIRYGKKITRISLSYRYCENGLELICEDDGCGIEDDAKEKIFERGFGNNTGLGLFLAREILVITGITLRENGEPGKGARFILSLPKGTFRFVER
ncbi:PAS domain S-box protein [Methanoregula sp.]|uniref:PAS domain S-box protein n=1 Tax=Methanoregula sp. TaxID=2052170 RepID=UPI0035688972